MSAIPEKTETPAPKNTTINQTPDFAPSKRREKTLGAGFSPRPSLRKFAPRLRKFNKYILDVLGGCTWQP